nr:zinc finger, CCHC-type, retrotransposon Gag domain protein [Tanacetum cinerariifolium]
MEKIFDVMGCKDAFKTRLAVYKFEGDALAWWKAYKQAKGGDVWLITATAPVDAENWISHMEKIFDVMGCEDAFKTRLAVYKFEGNALAWWKAYKQTKSGDAWLINVTWADFKNCWYRGGAGKELSVGSSQEILYERDDDDTERPDKRQKSGDRHQPTSQQSSHRNHGHNNDRHGSDRRGGGDNHHSNNNYSDRILVMGVTRETGVSSLTDLPFLVLSSPGVPLRATPIQFALLVDADTHESVVKLLVLALSVVKLAIYRKIARRTPLRVHLVRLIRSQIISALQARTLLSHGYEGFLATIHDTTSDVPSIHDQPIVSEFLD